MADSPRLTVLCVYPDMSSPTITSCLTLEQLAWDLRVN